MSKEEIECEDCENFGVDYECENCGAKYCAACNKNLDGKCESCSPKLIELD